SADAAFAPSWVDEAMDTLLRSVQEAEFGVLAREETARDGDSLFLLPLHLGRARSPLRDFLQRMFQTTTYERGTFLRGLYFVGDAATAPPHKPAFVADLFSEKIFGERGLAKPGPRVFPSKNKVVARLQLATLAIILGGPFGLYAGVNGVRVGPWRLSRGVKAEEASIRPLLRTIDVAVHAMRVRRDAFSNVSAVTPQEDMSVFRLLDDMASLSTNHMWSVFLPGTLLSPLHHDITDAIGLSFQTIILPEFRARMLYRARRLTDPTTRGVGREAAYGNDVRLPQYLAEISALGSNIERFNSLAQSDKGELEDLAAIVHYLYGEQVAPGFMDNDGYYRRALAEAHAHPIVIDERMRTLALRRSGQLTRDAYQALLTRLSGSTIGADNGADSDADEPADSLDLRAARADVDAVVGLRAFLDSGSPVEQALDSIHAPFAFGDGFAAAVRDTLAYYKNELTGRVLPSYADNQHTADGALRALDALLRQPFMQAPATRAINADVEAGVSLAWDPARLDEALAMKTAFDTFMARGLDPLPEALRNRVRRLATVQLGAAMTDIVAGGVREDHALSLRGDDSHDLTERVNAFTQASTRIAQLLDVFDAIGATSSYDALLDLSSAHANALLARADAMLDLPSR